MHRMYPNVGMVHSVGGSKMRRYDINKHTTHITDDDKAVSKYSNIRYTSNSIAA